MSDPFHASVALYYDPDGYVEQTEPAKPNSAPGPLGIMGRQVAGKEFLNAYLSHGHWDSLTAVVRSRDKAQPLLHYCQEHPSGQNRNRKLDVFEETHLEKLTSALIHFPNPPDTRFAWFRQSLPNRFALSGVTHTLSTPAATSALCDLVSTPTEEYDSLICTSRAVEKMVRAVTDNYCLYLRERFGGEARLLPRLATIPLGVDTKRFRPATSEQRNQSRSSFQIRHDEIVVLCVGRLSHHAKAHPYPLFHAVEQATLRTGQPVHLIMVGWAANQAIMKAFEQSAKELAPSVRVTFANGQNATVRTITWHAADIFASLPDNIQETFGLVPIEAMASGLPVLGSDWDGYRDLIVHGETGFLVPTHMMMGATAKSTERLFSGRINYDHFLAECSQTVCVDPSSAADALSTLILDPGLRQRMGEAGRRRAEEQFDWSKVIHAYERLWAEQIQLCLDSKPRPTAVQLPARFPAPEISFAGYPTSWLRSSTLIRTNAAAVGMLPRLLSLPITATASLQRCADSTILNHLLQKATDPTPVAVLEAKLEAANIQGSHVQATIAWLVKYDLLRVAEGGK